MKSEKHKLMAVLDNIHSIENYTNVKKCNFYKMCRIIDCAIVKITSKTINNLLGVDTVLWLFYTRDGKAETVGRLTHEHDIHEMFGAFYRTVSEHTGAENFSDEEFFKNLDKCHDIVTSVDSQSTYKDGLKYDAGKLKAGILADFPLALKAIAEVGTFGAKKYARNSWQNVDNSIERYTDAMWRHRLSEGVDDESGFPHYYHELWNMMAVIELKERAKRPLCDGRTVLSSQEEEILMFAEHLAANHGYCKNLSCDGSSGTVFEGRKCPLYECEEFPSCNTDKVYKWAKDVIKTLKGERS